MARADRHEIASHGRPEDSVAWLQKYGYRGVVAGVAGTAPGLLFARPGEPVALAVVGDVLRYDARKKVVVVE